MTTRISYYLIAISIMLGFVQDVAGQTTTFDNLNSSGSQKAITWNTSLHSAGFGHRWISVDPGNFTTLNLQTRNNTSTWSDVIVINSLKHVNFGGTVGIGVPSPAFKFHLRSTAADRARFEYGATTIDVVNYGAGTGDYYGSAGMYVEGTDALLMSGVSKGSA